MPHKPRWLRTSTDKGAEEEAAARGDDSLENAGALEERWQSAARDQWIIHTAGFFREPAALLGSADGNHFMGCCWKNSHIMSLADMSRVDTPRDRIRGSFPGQV